MATWPKFVSALAGPASEMAAREAATKDKGLRIMMWGLLKYALRPEI
jgi:hypothetical protein